MKLNNQNEKDIEDIKTCVNEIILYLLLNKIDTRNTFGKYSKEFKEKKFKDVKTYINYISKKIEKDTHEINISDYFDDDADEDESNGEIMSSLTTIFSKYLPILSSLHADNGDKVEDIVGKHITWDLR
uniref:Uncharacterized protein n=1 Tax=viral metagenome TaxID=1070528 RepID=A0A6C0AD00_9ZZZZ